MTFCVNHLAEEQSNLVCWFEHIEQVDDCSFKKGIRFLERSWTRRVSCKVSEAKGFTLNLQEARSIHDSMNLPKNRIHFFRYMTGENPVS